MAAAAAELEKIYIHVDRQPELRRSEWMNPAYYSGCVNIFSSLEMETFFGGFLFSLALVLLLYVCPIFGKLGEKMDSCNAKTRSKGLNRTEAQGYLCF